MDYINDMINGNAVPELQHKKTPFPISTGHRLLVSSKTTQSCVKSVAV